MRKTFLIASTTICIFVFLFSACSRKEKILIISTSGISDWLSNDTNNTGSFAILKKAIEKEKSYSIVLDMGNWLTTIPEGRLTKTNALIDCMNCTGYSFAMLGNKDLSFSPKNLNKPLTKSKFPILTSNVYLKTGSRAKYAKPRHIIKLKKTSIGLFSINTFEAQNLNSAKTLPFYRLEKENYEIARNVAALKESGAKIIIMLINVRPAKKDFPIKDFPIKDFYKTIARGNNAPDIVLINGLNSGKQLKINHTYFVNQVRNSSLALKTKISINTKTGKLSGIAIKTISLNKKKIGEDDKILKLETAHIKKIAAIFDKKIGSSYETLERTETGISTLANWIAQCMKRWSRAQGAVISCDVLKSNLSKGPITKRDIYKLLNYNTHIVYVKLRGKSLKNFINNNLDKGLGLAGITLSIKNNAAFEIKVNNRRLRPAKIYQITVPDYMLNEEKYALLPHAVEFVNKPKSIIEILKWNLRRNRKPIKLENINIK